MDVVVGSLVFSKTQALVRVCEFIDHGLMEHFDLFDKKRLGGKYFQENGSLIILGYSFPIGSRVTQITVVIIAHGRRLQLHLPVGLSLVSILLRLFDF